MVEALSWRGALRNFISGAGGSGDHSGGFFAPRPDKTPEEISEMLRHAPLVRTACEIMPEDIVRAWRAHPERADLWILREEALRYADAVERALFYSEAFGGALVMPIYGASAVDGNRLAQPFSAPKRGSLTGFKVFAPHELRAHSGNRRDEAQPNGLPLFFEVTGAGQRVKIHHSWVTPVYGAMAVTPPISSTIGGNLAHLLGASKVDLIFDDFSRAIAGLQGMSHLLAKANIDVLKVEGLADTAMKCHDTAEIAEAVAELRGRALATVSGASAMNPMLIDTNEALERHGLQAAGATDIARELMSAFVAATRIPRTRLMGEQAKGLDNGGQSDLTLYYERCAALRDRRATPFINWMDSISEADGGPKVTMWTYNPIHVPPAKERAETDKLNADIDAAYLNMDIPFIDDAVAKRLAQSGRYPFTAGQIAMIEAMNSEPDAQSS